MTLLAAALLMQAAAGATAHDAQAFDLASVPSEAADATINEALASSARFSDRRCSPEAGDPFEPEVIVVCAERPRVTYRVTTVSAPAESVPSATERLTSRVGCGVSQKPSGCFAGVPLIRLGFDGTAKLLPDRLGEAREPTEAGADD